MKDINYFNKSIKSLGHTPIYKMHKYFARRPHNVFRELIKHYSKVNDLLFDPFAGGGVTLIEGLTERRRIICADINPIASFIQLNQVNEIAHKRFVTLSKIINDPVEKEFNSYYTTNCSNCHTDAHVRWYEHAYLVFCPICKLETTLDNDSKAISKDSKPRNGIYKCRNCSSEFKAVEAVRLGSKILSIRFHCKNCGIEDNKIPDYDDFKKFEYFEKCYSELSEKYNIKIPNDVIPSVWDRQQEDCLHRKGFKYFKDLYTKRNLIVGGYYFTCIESSRSEMSINEYQFMLFMVSSLVRYINNMNFSTSSWMDGRPVAWAKHAYWTPYQFIEVNPIEYFSNRVKAFKSAITDRNSRFSNTIHSFNWKDVVEKKAQYSVYCGDSAKLALPDNSVDLILTDPPYGSNVQYGELCKFWQVWLNGKTPYKYEDELFKSEVIVHRKTRDKYYSKGFNEYYFLLKSIFTNCFRILKPGGLMVLTFNNKDIRAWYSVIKAAVDAGFIIEPEGIFYQEGIEAYRDTAHLRFDGTPQGDFIYSFIKKDEKIDFVNATLTFQDCLEKTINEIRSIKSDFTLIEYYIKLYSVSTIYIIKQITEGNGFNQIKEEFNFNQIEKFLKSKPFIIKNKDRWQII